MKWITRERPKIDRLACPWLIRRFIDPESEIIYVPLRDVMAQARALAMRGLRPIAEIQYLDYLLYQEPGPSTGPTKRKYPHNLTSFDPRLRAGISQCI